MKQNRKPRNRAKHVWKLYYDRSDIAEEWEKSGSSIKSQKQFVSTWGKKWKGLKFDTYIMLYNNTDCKWIKD